MAGAVDTAEELEGAPATCDGWVDIVDGWTGRATLEDPVVRPMECCSIYVSSLRGDPPPHAGRDHYGGGSGGPLRADGSSDMESSRWADPSSSGLLAGWNLSCITDSGGTASRRPWRRHGRPPALGGDATWSRMAAGEDLGAELVSGVLAEWSMASQVRRVTVS